MVHIEARLAELLSLRLATVTEAELLTLVTAHVPLPDSRKPLEIFVHEFHIQIGKLGIRWAILLVSAGHFPVRRIMIVNKNVVRMSQTLHHGDNLHVVHPKPISNRSDLFWSESYLARHQRMSFVG